MSTVTPFLWFDTQAEEAMNLYTSIFPRSKVLSVNRAQGRVMMVQVDELWTKLTADGGQPGQCGWLKDRFGLSWQIVPNTLGRLMGSGDAAGTSQWSRR